MDGSRAGAGDTATGGEDAPYGEVRSSEGSEDAAVWEEAVLVADSPGVVEVSEEGVPREAGRFMKTKDFIRSLDDQKIASAIGEAEKRTSGEIRVFVTERAVEDALVEAEKEFLKEGMEKTELRNGVLIYFAPRSQNYAIVGDKGVHEKCGQSFWEEISAHMAPHLKQHDYTEAVLVGVREAGEALARHFPCAAGDRNELPNQVLRDRNPGEERAPGE